VASFDGSSLPTGKYGYQLVIQRSSDQSEDVANGTLLHVNRARSPLHGGWWLAGLEQLVAADSGQRLWVGGDASACMGPSFGWSSCCRSSATTPGSVIDQVDIEGVRRKTTSGIIQLTASAADSPQLQMTHRLRLENASEQGTAADVATVAQAAEAQGDLSTSPGRSPTYHVEPRLEPAADSIYSLKRVDEGPV